MRVDRLQKLLFGLQLMAQRGNARIGLGAGPWCVCCGGCLYIYRWLRRHGCIFHHHQVQGGLLPLLRIHRNLAHQQVQTQHLLVELDTQARHPHRRLAAERLVQGSTQFVAQAFTRHLQNIVDADLALGGLQVLAGAAMQVKNIALGIHERGRRGHLL